MLPRPSVWGVQKVLLAPGESKVLTFSAAEGDWCPLCTVDGEGHRAVRGGAHVVRFGGDGFTESCDSASCVSTTMILKGPTQPMPL